MADQLPLKLFQERPQISKREKYISAHRFQVPNAVGSKKIYFYKSGDSQFSGIRMAVNSRTFKTFDSLLDDLSKKIPLPFGVRTITTPSGSNSVKSLSDLKDGQSYICSDQRRVKPINLKVANRKPHPWFISKVFNQEQLRTQQTRMKVSRVLYGESRQSAGLPKKLVVFRNGNPSFRRNLVLNKQTVQNFEELLNYITELMHFPVVKIYSTNGKMIETLYPVKYILDSVVAAGHEAYKPREYDISKSFLRSKLPATSKSVCNPVNEGDNQNYKVKSGRRRWRINSVSPSSSKPHGYTPSSDELSINVSKNPLGSSFTVIKDETSSYKDSIYAIEDDNPVMPSEDDIEKSVYVNEDGSVTVEMKVQLQIKEEEIIEWTTTISGTGVCDKKSNAYKSKLESRIEKWDFVQSHHQSKTMQSIDLGPEQQLDLCKSLHFTMDMEMDKGIWQNHFSNTNENLLGSAVELCHCKRGPPKRSVKQGEVSQEYIIAKADTQNSKNIIQYSNPGEAGLGEFTVELDNELISIFNENNSFEINGDAFSDGLHPKRAINVNTQGKEKKIQDKGSSFIGEVPSSRSSQQHCEDQFDAAKSINLTEESTRMSNVSSAYWGKNKCVDSDINFTKMHSGPSSEGPRSSISKQKVKDRRKKSTTFQYSRAPMPVQYETSDLSSGIMYSLTRTERKQIKDVNTRCPYSSGFCVARMPIVLADMSSVSRRSPSSTVKCQNSTKINNKGKMLMNTDLSDSFTNEEKTEDLSLVNTDLGFTSEINEKNCRDNSSGSTNLHTEYCSDSQSLQLLCQPEKNEVVSDVFTVPNADYEVVNSGKYENTDCNTTKVSDESKETFYIGSYGDISLSLCLTDLASPEEETNSNQCQIPIICQSDKRFTTTETLENRLQTMEDQHLITICKSFVTFSMPENVSEVYISQDIFSEHNKTIMTACTKQLHKAGDLCRTITNEDNSNLSESFTSMIDFDSECTFGKGNNSSYSTASAIQLCSSEPIRKKCKCVGKKNHKIPNIYAVEKDFKHNTPRAVLLSSLLHQNQKLCSADIYKRQNIVHNLPGISLTSHLMHHDKNLGPYLSTSFAEGEDSDFTCCNEANNLPDKDSDSMNQSEGIKAEIKVSTEHKLKQTSDKIGCIMKGKHEESEDCSNNYLLQCQLNEAEGKIKAAPISNEILCQPAAEMTTIESNKETNEIAVQVDFGVVSDTANERNSIEEQDLRQILWKLQSTVDSFKNLSHHRQKSHLKESYRMPDMSEHLAATLSTSSKVLLAWLAIINLNVSTPSATEAALVNKCGCSEVLTFLELIRHVVKFQKSTDAKENISDLQKCASHLVKLWANEYKEESNCIDDTDPKVQCPLQSETSADKQTVLFGTPQQLTSTIENDLDMQNLIEKQHPIETKREVEINVSTHPNEEGKKKKAFKEVGSNEIGLVNSKDHLVLADILEDQVACDSIHQNVHTVENTAAMNKEWNNKKLSVLALNENLKKRVFIEHEKFIANRIKNIKNVQPVYLMGIDTKEHLTSGNATAGVDDFLAVSDVMPPKTKISPQSHLDHESLLTTDKYGPNDRNYFYQVEHRKRNNVCENKLPASASVFSVAHFENESKNDSKQQANKISDNLFFEDKADSMELLSCVCPCVPPNYGDKHSLKRQLTHDLSDGDQTSANSIASDYNSQASNEMTTEGEEDNFVKSNHFSANFVRKATDRLYGKSKVISRGQPPLSNDTSRGDKTCSVKNELLNISGLTKGETFKTSQINNSHSEEEGVFIEKGRWLLKENHLIRKSPPLNLIMSGNLDTSVDTTFDNTSDDMASPHVCALHSVPPLSEMSSSEIEEMIKPKATCNYFSMPHASDSEPFSDLISLESKQGHASRGSNLIQKTESDKRSVRTSAKLSMKVDDDDSSFASVGIHMFNNKVGPLAQPLPDRILEEQGPEEAARINRALPNPDSLDKLHLLCGQHCPILTAVIEPSNEGSRRFVYRKKTDLENQRIPYLEDGCTIRKYECLMTESGTCMELNKVIIDSIVDDTSNWFKTPSIYNKINRIKLGLDAKYLGTSDKILKLPLHTDKGELVHKDKPYLSEVIIEVKKKYIKNIVKRWFMKQKMQNSIKAIKEKINRWSVQAQKVEDPLSGQTDSYILSARISIANNNIIVPLLESEIISLVFPSEDFNRNDVAFNSEKEQFCGSQKPRCGNNNK